MSTPQERRWCSSWTMWMSPTGLCRIGSLLSSILITEYDLSMVTLRRLCFECQSCEPALQIHYKLVLV